MSFFRWFIVREHISAWLFTPGVGSINHKANSVSWFDGFLPHTPTDELAFVEIGKMQIFLPQSDAVKLQIVAALFYLRFRELFEVIFIRFPSFLLFFSLPSSSPTFSDALMLATIFTEKLFKNINILFACLL